MAHNEYGFISKRYKQPLKYDLIFNKFNAIYHTNTGREVMIEAEPYPLAPNVGTNISHYSVIIREPDCRRVVKSRIKTQKEAILLIEKLIEKY